MEKDGQKGPKDHQVLDCKDKFPQTEQPDIQQGVTASACETTPIDYGYFVRDLRAVAKGIDRTWDAFIMHFTIHTVLCRELLGVQYGEGAVPVIPEIENIITQHLKTLDQEELDRAARFYQKIHVGEQLPDPEMIEPGEEVPQFLLEVLMVLDDAEILEWITRYLFAPPNVLEFIYKAVTNELEEKRTPLALSMLFRRSSEKCVEKYEWICRGLVNNFNTPTHILQGLMKCHEVEVRMAIPVHPNTTPEMVTGMANSDDDIRIRIAIAGSSHITEEVALRYYEFYNDLYNSEDGCESLEESDMELLRALADNFDVDKNLRARVEKLICKIEEDDSLLSEEDE